MSEADGQGRRGPVEEARVLARYMRALPRFLRTPLAEGEARPRIAAQLARREDTFLRLLRDGVFANPASPYRPLLAAAGAECGDVEAMVRADGLEAALGELYDAGVRVRLDEFKSGGARFDNPIATTHFTGSTGGSSGAPQRVPFDLALLEHEAAHHALFREAFGLHARPFGVWRVIPPSASGLNNCLRQVKAGGTVARWFTPVRGTRDLDSLKFAAFTKLTVVTARAAGVRLPFPEHCAPGDARRVAEWLAGCRAAGKPALLDAQAGIGVRACLAAEEHGIDISGTLFRFGGEPYTAGKQAVVERAGCRALNGYSSAELSRIGFSCTEARTRDDVHVLTDKIAVLQRRQAIGSDGAGVDALVYTSLHPAAPKLMINVVSGDYGVLEERACGCPWGELGLTTHVSGVRAYDKLTAEGNQFLGEDLIELVDEVLPARFGGGPTDFQLVEEEVDGLPKVSVVVRPSIGAVDEPEVVEAVLGHLGSRQRLRLMAQLWREGETLRVVRSEPYTRGPGAKIQPLLSASTPRSAHPAAR